MRATALEPRRVFDRVGTPRTVDQYLRRMWRRMSDQLLEQTTAMLFGVVHARDPGSRRLFDGISGELPRGGGRYIAVGSYYRSPVRHGGPEHGGQVTS